MAAPAPLLTVLHILLVHPLCAVQVTNFDINVDVNTRIFGGIPAAYQELPHQAALIHGTLNVHLCGAVIISPRVALTAAHCIHKRTTPQFKPYKIMAGHIRRAGLNGYDQSAQISNVMEVRVHQQYKSLLSIHLYRYWPKFYPINDIAILFLETPLKFNAFVNKVPVLPKGTPLVGMRFIASGWGMTAPGKVSTDLFPEVLRKVDLPFVPRDKCSKMNGPSYPPSQICAGGERGKDTCKGDSGGPLTVVVRGITYVVGITSFGARSRCGDLPGVYTAIAEYIPWIQNEARKLGIPVNL